MNVVEYEEQLYTFDNFEQLEQLFELQRAYIMRKKIHFTFILVQYNEQSALTFKQLYEDIASQLRNSDFIFKNEEQQTFLLMLSLSKVIESVSFLQRLETVLEHVGAPLKVVITEVATAKVSLQEILNVSYNSLQQLLSNEEDISVVSDFLQGDEERVKVSILENDSVALSIFQNIFNNMHVPQIELDVKCFKDGKDFVDSDWYRSAHHHIVLINDLLPRKNGFEILRFLRELPNSEKYLIYFISARISEDAQLNAYENGADAYFVRPFNLKILEAQLKNYLQRLR